MTTGTGPWTSTSRTSTTQVSGTRLGEEETEDLKRAVKKKTVDDHRQDINDPRALGTRPGGTKAMKMTEDDHQQDINDRGVLGTRLGGAKAMKKTVDDHQQDTGFDLQPKKYTGDSFTRMSRFAGLE